MLKSCCVTGHRNIPAEKIDYIKQELRKEIMLAFRDGCTHFISGFADGVDLLFAEIVAELKTKNPDISLEAAIPYRNRLKAKNNKFQKLIKVCDKVTVIAENYSKNCYMARNMYIVQQSQHIIAAYDGRESGGTEFTIRYGRTQGRVLRIINILD